MTLIKTCTFAVMHFSIAFTVVYLLTGSVLVGGTVALIEPACNTVAFFLHEKLWDRLQIERRPSGQLRAVLHRHA